MDEERKEYNKIYDNLPKDKKDALFAENNIDAVWKIGEKNHLNNERIKILAKIVGDVIIGVIATNDFSKELAEKTGINIEVAKGIVEELRSTIPFLGDLTNSHETEIIEETPSSVEESSIETKTLIEEQPKQKTSQSTIESKIKKNAVPEKSHQTTATPQQNEEQPAPFIIHKETGVSQVEAPTGEGRLERPYFYKPTSNPENYSASEQKKPVRLEIGEVFDKKPSVEKETGKTAVPEMRTVNYSGPKTEVDPFSKQKYEDIHPDNEVDLKEG